jgi:hypothetical protein
MEDESVARNFLSTIIGEKVIDLDFAASERTIGISLDDRNKRAKKTPVNLTVCRFDFSARISLPGGRFKTILVELQKAKIRTDVMRFRRYIGAHYQDQDNTYLAGDGNKYARQIYCILLLGYDVGATDIPVIEMKEDIWKVAPYKNTGFQDELMDSLYHRLWIVQTQRLKHRRPTELDKLMGVFDQSKITKNPHILDVNEDDFPENLSPVLRRLRMACESDKIRGEMEMEDDYLEELRKRDREKEQVVAMRDTVIKEQKKTIKQKDKALEKSKKTLEKSKKTIKQNKKDIEQKDKALEQKDKDIEELKRQLSEIREESSEPA